MLYSFYVGVFPILRRPLKDRRYVDDFLIEVLFLHQEKKENKPVYEQAITKILYEENALANSFKNNTLVSTAFRDSEYLSDEDRVLLRKRIINELCTMKRLDDDEEIQLGKGGVLPQNDNLKSEKQAYFIIGLPASGKSGIANSVSDGLGALIIDNDYAKRKFPEFEFQCGATVVHEESSIVMVGGGKKHADEESVLAYAIKHGFNIVLPKIGAAPNTILESARLLNDISYQCHLVLVRLDRCKATLRAFKRFMETGRYVPLSMICDEYADSPTISFYDIMIGDAKELFASYAQISTDVARGNKAQVTFCTDNSPIKLVTDCFDFRGV